SRQFATVRDTDSRDPKRKNPAVRRTSQPAWEAIGFDLSSAQKHMGCPLPPARAPGTRGTAVGALAPDDVRAMFTSGQAALRPPAGPSVRDRAIGRRPGRSAAKNLR